MAIFLTGFMGTGKTAIGRALAARLGKEFLDLDAEVERRSGRSIQAIFAADGEASFRRIEAETLRDVAARDIVVATGGGAIVATENAETMHRHGPVVGLTASVEEILRRTSSDTARPLLAGDGREGRVRSLLAARAGAYARADIQVDTTQKPVTAVVDEILGFLARRGGNEPAAERQ